MSRCVSPLSSWCHTRLTVRHIWKECLRFTDTGTRYLSFLTSTSSLDCFSLFWRLPYIKLTDTGHYVELPQLIYYLFTSSTPLPLPFSTTSFQPLLYLLYISLSFLNNLFTPFSNLVSCLPLLFHFFHFRPLSPLLRNQNQT